MTTFYRAAHTPSHYNRTRIPFVLAGFLLAFLLSAPAAWAQAVITVNSNADTNVADGSCTLREALLNARDNNAGNGDCVAGTNTGTDTIRFTGSFTFTPGSALPDIADDLIIDGITSTGATCGTSIDTQDLRIVLDGSSAGNTEGLWIRTGDATTVRGLVIHSFTKSGITIEASDNHVIECNRIGTDAAGTTAQPNGQHAITINASTGNTIQDNLLSGNTSNGIQFEGTGSSNFVYGNWIGVDATGNTALGNGDGIAFNQADNNTIGGTTAAQRNIISGNTGVGIRIEGFLGSPEASANGNVIQGNYIGTDAAGTGEVSNNGPGVVVGGSAEDTTIGGTAPGAGNVISGNGSGVNISGADAINVVVQGNYIGVNATGNMGLNNNSDGISLVNTSGHTIGGTAAGAGNVISGNGGNGIYMVSTPGSTTDSNTIAGNTIGLGADGTTTLGNGTNGIYVANTSNTTIGGTVLAARNVISGNGQWGVILEGDPTNARILGNYIGTDANGTAARGNADHGVYLNHVTSVEVATNLISGNTGVGIYFDGGYTHTIEANTIGLNATGTAAIPNLEGIQIDGSNGSTIISNTISGNTGSGIHLRSSSFPGGLPPGQDPRSTQNFIRSNVIGLGLDGTTAIGNDVGIRIWDSFENTIGDGTGSDPNVISGNTSRAIMLLDPGTTGNLIQNNLIGTDISGTVGVGNGGGGSAAIYIQEATNNTIGGTDIGARNIISGNGIGIGLNTADGNTIQGNYIGVDFIGTGALPNNIGIQVVNSANTVIGGTAANARNVISGNTANGINIVGEVSDGTLIQNNYIGTTPTGNAALANGTDGITIIQGDGTNILNNTIAGNLNDSGIFSGFDTDGTVVQGNHIGVGADGTTALGNLNGVIMSNSANGVIGGTNPGEGNVISSNNGAGILLEFAATTNTTILGNLIGTDASGMLKRGNTAQGIRMWEGTSSNIVGDGSAAGRNVISGNADSGILITADQFQSDTPATNNTVKGNYIGTNASGGDNLGNGGSGIEISRVAADNQIGGTVAGAGNVIANNNRGVSLLSGATNNTFEGNYIGTDASGTLVLGNAREGFFLLQIGVNNALGGSAPDAGNLIAGSGSLGGIFIFLSPDQAPIEGNTVRNNPGARGIYLSNSPNITVRNNTVTDNAALGISAISSPNTFIDSNTVTGNGTDGVSVLSRSPDVTVTDNTITGNGGRGIRVDDGGVLPATTNVTLSRNTIAQNGGLGIERNTSNNITNYPELTTISYNTAGTSVTLGGTLNTYASTNVTLEFFAGATCDGSGFGEAPRFLGDVQVLTDGSGNAAISETLVTDPAYGRVITVTATAAPHGTSELSRCIGAPELVIPQGHVSALMRDDLNLAQGIGFDSAGNLLIASTGNGRILYLDPSGTPVGPDPLVSGLTVAIDVALYAGQVFFTDGPAGNVYKVDLADALTNGPLDASTLTPWATGLNGPGHLTLGPDGLLYVSLVRNLVGERIVRVDPNVALNPTVTEVIAFDDGQNINPQGTAFDVNGDLYMALQNTGQVVRATAAQLAGALPVSDASLTTVFSSLDNPNGLSFNANRKLFVTTPTAVLSGGINALVPTPFVSGLGGYTYNQIAFKGNALYLNDGAGRRLAQVAAPQQQVQEFGSLTFTLSTNGAGNITDGSDLQAIRNAFASWEGISTTNVDFIDGGTTTQTQANATDGVNLITFEDDMALDDFILAVVAKTIEFGNAPGQAKIIDADMIFNKKHVTDPNFRYGTDTVPGTYDVESIAAHEIGHLIGLQHSGYLEGTMFFALPFGKEARTLEEDEIAKVSAAYPSATFATTYGTLTGTLTDGEAAPGTPIAAALVTATDVNNPSNVVTAYTDENGSYTIKMLPGNYRVHVQPLDGDVGGFPMRPANVSAYLETIANNTRFIEEYYTTGDSNDPNTDIATDFTPVSVTAGNTTSNINIVTNQDLTPPAVAAVTPAAGAVGVPRKAEVLIRFSETIDAGTLSLALDDGSGPVGGTLVLVTKDNPLQVLWSFKPSGLLNSGATYTLTIGGGLQDLRGNAMGSNFVSTFSTVAPDVVAPTVTQVTPTNGATGVFTGQVVTVKFSEAMASASLAGNLSVSGPGGPVGGTVALSPTGTSATFTLTPGTRYAEATLYTITVGTGLTDLEGNALPASVASTFTTVNVEAPTVTAVGPADGKTNIITTTRVFADFSEPIDPATVSATSFNLKDAGGATVAGTFAFSQDNTRVIFRPAAPLAFNTLHTLTIGTTITDASPVPQPVQAGSVTTFTTALGPSAPVITSVSPLSAVVRKVVVITGEGFDPSPTGNIVSFNGVQAPVVDVTLTSLTVTVPDGATDGPLTVSVGAQTSNAILFDVVTELPTTDEVVAKSGAGSEPRDADVGPDGTFAYITNSADNSVSVIDIANLAVVSSISLAPEETPLKIVVSPDGTRAYVTNFNTHSVSVIDTATNAVIDVVPVGLNPIGIAITPDGSRVYVAESTGKGISVIDANPNSGTYNRVVARTASGSENKDAEIGPDGTFLYVTGNDGLAIIDISPDSPTFNEVVARTASGSETEDVDVGPDGTYAFVTTSTGEILVIDISPFSQTPYEVVYRTASGSEANEVEVGPDGTILYATNFESGTVSVYRFTASVGGATKTASVVSRGWDEQPATNLTFALILIDVIGVGTGPEAIVFSPANNLAIVPNAGSDDVSVIYFNPGVDVDEDGLPDARQQLLLDLQTLAATPGLDKKVQKDVEKAAKSVEKSLDPDLWIDAEHLDDKHGHKVYNEDKSAIKDLEKITQNGNGDAVTTAEDGIVILLDDGRRLAAKALEEATDGCTSGKCLKELDKANEALLEGDEEADEGDFDKAIDDYKKAWEHALKAIQKASKGYTDPIADEASLLEDDPAQPITFALEQNYPNPFNPVTVIQYALPEATEVSLTVYNVLGQRVQVLVEGTQQAGYHSISFDARNLPSGLYLYRILAGTNTQVRTMILLR